MVVVLIIKLSLMLKLYDIWITHFCYNSCKTLNVIVWKFFLFEKERKCKIPIFVDSRFQIINLKTTQLTPMF